MLRLVSDTVALRRGRPNTPEHETGTGEIPCHANWLRLRLDRLSPERMNISEWGLFDWILAFVGLVALVVVPAIQFSNSTERGKLAAKWIVSLIVMTLMATICAPMMRQGGYRPLGGLFFALILTCPLIALWVPAIADLLVSPFSSLYAGSNAQIDKVALLSRVEGLRRQDKYQLALEEAESQLEQFPNDFDCQMIIASIHAENLKALPTAVEVVETAIANANAKKLPRFKISYAYNTLADWHLKYAKDPEAARECLQKIIDRYPDTKASQTAHNRIAHLATREAMEQRAITREIPMREFERDIGLRKITPRLVEEIDYDEIAAGYHAKLREFPNDLDTRESLAKLYVTHYQRVDLAAEEIYRLIEMKGAGREKVAHWLHQLANWHAKVDKNPEAAEAVLQKIIDRYPGSAFATRAVTAMNFVKVK